ncbi:transposase [Pseudobutyrivibrio sp. ACV-2]|uniref:IS66 family insertion sequence element accessory protein TnpB n=1 Tax=Pseudobutyrivibrio sp. ACV-2 TaxID=1520801 RepID=UPI00089A0A3D|nr:IS66 family insertion sequence element accessory protein TnpB [Pseudobutyrivibrio sp. ACV-2]SEB07848.1 transposase [Pseudobutyrivibrio sp. ACV-2]
MLTEKGFTFSKVYILIGKSDLRKGIDGLSALVKLHYNKNPLEKDTLFLFCGTRKDRLKGILWTGDRFILLYIRLAEGSFRWPKSEDEARQLSGDEFMRLMEGFAIDPSVGKKRTTTPIEFRKK